MKYIIGIDLGGTTIKFGLFSNEIKLLDTWFITTPSKDVIKGVNEEVSRYLTTKNIETTDLLGIGLAVASPVKNGVSIHFSNVNIPDGTNISKEIYSYFNSQFKVVVANDANAAAYGEYSHANIKSDNAVFLTLGTGTGGGLIINGKLVEGEHGSASEFGHLLVDPDEEFTCGCGYKGCLEQYSSLKGLDNLLNKYFKTGKYTTKLDINNYTGKIVFDLAKENDELCSLVVDEFTRYLGIALANISMSVDPSLYILGGGISKAGDFLLHKVKSSFKRYARFDTSTTPIQLATLGNQAGIFGSAYLIIQ
jgi:glucokinase